MANIYLARTNALDKYHPYLFTSALRYLQSSSDVNVVYHTPGKIYDPKQIAEVDIMVVLVRTFNETIGKGVYEQILYCNRNKIPVYTMYERQSDVSEFEYDSYSVLKHSQFQFYTINSLELIDSTAFYVDWNSYARLYGGLNKTEELDRKLDDIIAQHKYCKEDVELWHQESKLDRRLLLLRN